MSQEKIKFLNLTKMTTFSLVLTTQAWAKINQSQVWNEGSEVSDKETPPFNIKITHFKIEDYVTNCHLGEINIIKI